jgi:hypothetical protein
VSLGSQARLTIKITNKGNLPATITSASVPAVPFGNPSPVAQNLPLNPGYDLVIPLTYTPTSIGASSGSYRIRWTDATGSHALRVPVTGTGVAPASGIAVPGPGGGWTLNGSAAMSGTTLSLTQLSQFQQGSAVYSAPEPSNGLSATFTAQLGGGTGADGLTMSLLDARHAGPASLGGAGAELGYGGLPGVAVTLVTHQAPGEPSANFIGIATGLAGTVPKFAATSSAIPSLRTGRHVIKVRVSGQTITVFVDGKRVLSPTLRAGTIPPSVRVAFTAGSGVRTDNHQVSRVTITAGGGRKLPPPGGGWSYNGSASMGGSATFLTRAVPSQAGSVVYPVPVTTSGLRVQFNLQMSGGSGGYGITFALLNPSSASATSVGAGGAKLGFGGLKGSAVAMVSSMAPGYPAGNFAGISTGVSGGVLSLRTYATNISPLRSGTHTVSVRITARKVMIVFMDGQQLMQEPLPGLPGTALLAFTAGTGTSTDDQVIRSVAISATG